VVTFSLHFWRQFAPDNNPYLYTTWRQNPKHIAGILSGIVPLALALALDLDMRC
jgi:hypothetical protein